MRKRLTLIAAITLLGMILVPSASYGQGGGKQVFVASKCTMCHTVKSMGIQTTGHMSKPFDLSRVGASHNAAWFKPYLLKQTALNGKQHIKKFTGAAAQLNQLANWLSTLR